ncbi:hypothetical protein WJX79_006482 [Trebouxia sp. C0005]
MLRAMQWHEEKAQGPEPTDGHASKQSVVRQGSGWPDGDASRRDLHSLREAPLQPGGDPSQSGPPQPVFFWGPDWGTMLLVVSMLTEGATAVGLGTTISKPSGWFFTGVLSTRHGLAEAWTDAVGPGATQVIIGAFTAGGHLGRELSYM